MASMAFERLENPVNLVDAETLVASTSNCFWWIAASGDGPKPARISRQSRAKMYSL